MYVLRSISTTSYHSYDIWMYVQYNTYIQYRNRVGRGLERVLLETRYILPATATAGKRLLQTQLRELRLLFALRTTDQA
jgi:hypothetical protein